MDAGGGKLVDPVADLQGAVGAALHGQNLVEGLVASYLLRAGLSPFHSSH